MTVIALAFWIVLLLLNRRGVLTQESTKKMLDFGASVFQKYESQNYALLDSKEENQKVTETRALSVCFRLQLRYASDIRIFGKSEFDFVIKEANGGYGFLKTNRTGRVFDLSKFKISVARWHSYCFTIEQRDSSQAMTLMIDGQTLLDQVFTDLDYFKPILLTSPLMLGSTKRDSFGNGLYGKMSDVNVWTRIIEIWEMAQFTENCSDIENIKDLWLNWNQQEFDGVEAPSRLGNSTSMQTVSSSSVCGRSNSKRLLVFAMDRPYHKAKRQCLRLGGELRAPNLQDDEKHTVTTVGPKSKCVSFWAPIVQGPALGNGSYQWLDDSQIGNSKVLSNIRWGPSDPNGLQHQKCVAFKNGVFIDQDCDGDHHCFVCSMRDYTPFYLRRSESDHEIAKGTANTNGFKVFKSMTFSLTISRQTHLEFLAFEELESKWLLQWYPINKTANLYEVQEKGLGKKLVARAYHVKFGLISFQHDKQSFEAKFTKCDPLTQFTCSGGECISLEKRCDRRADCQDGSDENRLSCQIASIRESTYQRETPPMPTNEEKLEVQVGFDVQMIDRIDVQNLQFNMKLEVILRWLDPRIEYFQNLKPDFRGNIIHQKSSEPGTDSLFDLHIWFPPLMFSNTVQPKTIKLEDNSILGVLRTGNGTPAEIGHLHEALHYKSEENQLEMRTTVVSAFKCNFKLVYYPFDVQVCYVEIKVPEELQSRVNLTIGFLKSLSGRPTPTEFDVRGMEIRSIEEDRVRLCITLKRNYGIYFLNLFIPTLCLISAATVTLYVDKCHFEINVQVALTSTLVMYTLFSTVSDKLPDSGTIKMIDIWLIHGLINPFMVFCALIASKLMDQRKQRSEKRLVAVEKMLPPALSDKSIVPCDGKTKRRPKAKELRKEKWDILVTSQKLFPAITAIFVTVFFAVAIPDWKFQ